MLSLSLEPAVIEVGGRTPVVVRLTNSAATELSQIRLSFRLPEGLELLRGQTSLLVQRLRPGETLAVPLVVQARRAGRLALEQLNLSFRDAQGRPRRYEGEVPAWIAQAARPTAPPPPPAPARLELVLAPDVLRQGLWTLLKVTVRNHGPGAAQRIRLWTPDPRWQAQPAELERLLPEEQADLLVNLKPLEAGELSLTWHLRYELADGTVEEQHFPVIVSVEKPESAPSTVTQIGQVWQIGGDVGLIKQAGQQPGQVGSGDPLRRCPVCHEPLSGLAYQRFCDHCGAELTVPPVS